MKKSVLFVCIHNSARSQMAEAWLNHLCPEFFAAESAGLEPGVLNPLVIEAMRETGLDLSGNRTKSVQEMLNAGRRFDYVVTVCDETSAERCPIFPGAAERLHWGFPDPSTLNGSKAEKMDAVREIRNAIRAQVQRWCDPTCASRSAMATA